MPRDGEGTSLRAVAPYIPLDGRAWRLAMGLRPLDLAQWIEFGPDADVQLSEKARLLRHHFSEVVALRSDGADASEELLGEVLENLSTHHPTRSRSINVDEPALVSVARLVPEDLCVLKHLEGQWRMTSACVCFPSRWSLAEKIGTSLDEIHAPVPGYGEQLASPTNSFFERLGDRRAFWRLNWTLLDSAELFQPTSRRGEIVDDPARWQFRVERQTLRRLPETGAIIFTIRTYVSSASALVATVENFAEDVHEVLSTAPSATLAYKGWEGLDVKWQQWHLATGSATDNLPGAPSSTS